MRQGPRIVQSEALERVRDLVMLRLTTNLQATGKLDQLLDDLATHKTDPAAAARVPVGGE